MTQKSNQPQVFTGSVCFEDRVELNGPVFGKVSRELYTNISVNNIIDVGWVISGNPTRLVVFLPAGRTTDDILIPLTDFKVGDILQEVSLLGAIQSVGGTVDLSMDLRSTLEVLGGTFIDTSLGLVDLGAGVTADTVLTKNGLLSITNINHPVDIGEVLFIALKGTTAALTEIGIANIVVKVDRNQ